VQRETDVFSLPLLEKVRKAAASEKIPESKDLGSSVAAKGLILSRRGEIPRLRLNYALMPASWARLAATLEYLAVRVMLRFRPESQKRSKFLPSLHGNSHSHAAKVFIYVK